MTAQIKPVSWKILVRKLSSLGFSGPYAGGKHNFMVRGELRLTIPNPHTGDIDISLLSEILSRGNISRQEWLTAK